MGRECTICSKPKSNFVMNNKLVCFRCDELLFDMEIELEETDQTKTETTRLQTAVATAQTAKTSKE